MVVQLSTHQTSKSWMQLISSTHQRKSKRSKRFIWHSTRGNLKFFWVLSLTRSFKLTLRLWSLHPHKVTQALQMQLNSFSLKKLCTVRAFKTYIIMASYAAIAWSDSLFGINLIQFQCQLGYNTQITSLMIQCSFAGFTVGTLLCKYNLFILVIVFQN